MKVAALQMVSTDALAENLEQASLLLSQAAAQGAELQHRSTAEFRVPLWARLFPRRLGDGRVERCDDVDTQGLRRHPRHGQQRE